MNMANLKASPLVSAAEESTRPTSRWLAYLFSVIVAQFIVVALIQAILRIIFSLSSQDRSHPKLPKL